MAGTVRSGVGPGNIMKPDAPFYLTIILLMNHPFHPVGGQHAVVEKIDVAGII